MHESKEYDIVFYLVFTSHQQSFSYVGTGLPGLNQYLARINVSCSRTQRSKADEARTRGPSISSQADNVTWAGSNTVCSATIKRYSFDLIGGSEKGRFNAIQHQSRLSSTAGCHQRGSSHQSSQRPSCRRRRKLEPVAVAV